MNASTFWPVTQATANIMLRDDQRRRGVFSPASTMEIVTERRAGGDRRRASLLPAGPASVATAVEDTLYHRMASADPERDARRYDALGAMRADAARRHRTASRDRMIRGALRTLVFAATIAAAATSCAVHGGVSW